MELGFTTPIKNNKAFESDHAHYTDDVNAHSTYQTPAKGYSAVESYSGREHLSSDLATHIRSIVDEFKTDSAKKHDGPLKIEDLTCDTAVKTKAPEDYVTAETTPALSSLYNTTHLLSSHVSGPHNLSLSHHISPTIYDHSSTVHHVDYEPHSNDLLSKFVKEDDKNIHHYSSTEPAFTSSATTGTGSTYNYGSYGLSPEDIKKYLPAEHHHIYSTTTGTSSLFQPEKAITTTVPEKDHHNEVYKSTLLTSLLNHDDKHSYEKLSHVNDSTPTKLKTETLFNLGNRNEDLIKSIVGQYKDLNANTRTSVNVLYEDPLSLTQNKMSSSNVFKNSHVFTSTSAVEPIVQPTYTSHHYETDFHHYPEHSSNTLEHSEKITAKMSEKIDHIDHLIQEIKNRNAKMTNSCLHSLGKAPIDTHFAHHDHHNHHMHHNDHKHSHKHEEEKKEVKTQVKEVKHHNHHHKKEAHKGFDLSTQFLAKAVTVMLVIILVTILGAQLFYDFQ